eukprot:gene4045-5787_t
MSKTMLHFSEQRLLFKLLLFSCHAIFIFSGNQPETFVKYVHPHQFRLNLPYMDRTSIISRYYSHKYFETAFNLFQNWTEDDKYRNSPKEYLDNLINSYDIFPTEQAGFLICWMYDMIGDADLSMQYYDESIKLLREDIFNHLKAQNKENDFITLNYDQILIHKPHNFEALFSKGLFYSELGDIHKAADSYFRCIDWNPYHIKCLLNIASLHHKYGNPVESISYYCQIINITKSFEKYLYIGSNLRHEYYKTKTNLCLALMHKGDIKMAFSTVMELIEELELRYFNYCYNNNQEHIFDHSFTQNLAVNSRNHNCMELYSSISIAYGHKVNIQRSIAYWNEWEVMNHKILFDTIRSIDHYDSKLITVQSFESLLMPISMDMRLKIAKAVSTIYPYSYYYHHQTSEGFNRNDFPTELRLGFISYDFNDHPTTHLIEGIFQVIHQSRKRNIKLFNNVKLFVYSYGKDDNSSYRNNLKQMADKFTNIAELSFNDSSEVICNDNIDVLLDMQIHTLGSRLQISANHPAPIQINYLVYPGTSGASFYDSIIGDKIVTPPEHVQYYSESLILLPPTYQISYYNQYDNQSGHSNGMEFGCKIIDYNYKQSIRRILSLPLGEDIIIFCNFNKIDKLDLVTFKSWMMIMKRVKKSYLWLLEPYRIQSMDDKNHQQNLITKQNLLKVALSFGISKSRIMFAPRVNKQYHIWRHIAADIFLDTFIYGAHSTATDAIRGGLPVLTIAGDSFPNRVIYSLYSSFDNNNDYNINVDNNNNNNNFIDLLVAYSVKDYENQAVRLANQQNQLLLYYLHNKILKLYDEKKGLFNVNKSVTIFIQTMQALSEFSSKYSHYSRIPHLIIPFNY